MGHINQLSTNELKDINLLLLAIYFLKTSSRFLPDSKFINAIKKIVLNLLIGSYNSQEIEREKFKALLNVLVGPLSPVKGHRNFKLYPLAFISHYGIEHLVTLSEYSFEKPLKGNSITFYEALLSLHSDIFQNLIHDDEKNFHY